MDDFIMGRTSSYSALTLQEPSPVPLSTLSLQYIFIPRKSPQKLLNVNLFCNHFVGAGQRAEDGDNDDDKHYDVVKLSYENSSFPEI